MALAGRVAAMVIACVVAKALGARVVVGACVVICVVLRGVCCVVLASVVVLASIVVLATVVVLATCVVLCLVLNT